MGTFSQMSAGSIPAFEWEYVSTVPWWQIGINRNGQSYFSQWLASTTWSPPSPLPPGNYEWSVRGWNPNGLGKWSPLANLVVTSEENPITLTGLRGSYGVVLQACAIDNVVGSYPMTQVGTNPKCWVNNQERGVLSFDQRVRNGAAFSEFQSMTGALPSQWERYATGSGTVIGISVDTGRLGIGSQVFISNPDTGDQRVLFTVTEGGSETRSEAWFRF